MQKSILELFRNGQSGTRTTLFQDSNARLDEQNNDISGNTISSHISQNIKFTNYSFQSGNDSFAVFYIENGSVSRTEIENAQSNFHNNKKFDARLLRTFATQLLFSNSENLKIVCLQKSLKGIPSISQQTEQVFDQIKKNVKKSIF